MSKFLEAAEAAKNLNKMVRGVLLVGELLEQVGSLESAAEDAKKHAAKAKAELEAAVKELAKAQAEVAREEEKAEKVREAAAAAKAKTLADASAQAERTVEAAKSKAAEVLSAAAAEAAHRRQEVDGHVHAAGIALDEASRTLDAFHLKTQERRAELEVLEKNLAKAKAEAARIFGLKE